MKITALFLALVLSAAVYAADAYTPVYDSNGIFVAVLAGGSNSLTVADANFQTWVATAYPADTTDASIALWKAANPWQPWGALTLPQYQAQQLAKCENDAVKYFAKRYPQHRQMQLEHIENSARAKGWVNAVAYCERLWTYQLAILQIYATAAAQIQTATTCQQVSIVTWNYASVETVCPDPLVTVATALGMTN